MYIPGIKYNRQVRSYAQEDVGRFQRGAILKDRAAQKQTELSISQNALPIQQQFADMSVRHEIQNVNLANTQMADTAAMQQSQARTAGKLELGAALVNNVLVPLGKQQRANQKHESDIVYSKAMTEVMAAISANPTRQDPETGRTVSNSDTAFDAMAEGQAQARELASEGISIPGLQRDQDRAWDNQLVVANSELNKVALQWDQDLAGSQATANLRGHLENQDWSSADAVVEEALANNVYGTDIDKYQKDKALIKEYKETDRINRTILALSDLTDTTTLEAFSDTLRGGNTAIPISAATTLTYVNSINTIVDALGRDKAADDILKRGQNIGTAVTNMLTDADDPLIGRMGAVLNAASEAYAAANGEKDWFDRESLMKKVDANVASSIADIHGDLMRKGEFLGAEQFYNYVLTTTDSQALGFLNPTTAADAQTALSELMAGMQKSYADQVTVSIEARIDQATEDAIAGGDWVGGDDVTINSLGEKVIVTGQVLADNLYNRALDQMALFSSGDGGGVILPDVSMGEMQHAADAAIINSGMLQPALWGSEIGNGLSSSDSGVVLGTVNRLLNMRAMETIDGIALGSEFYNDIYSGLSVDQKTIFDFVRYRELGLQDSLSPEQKIDLDKVIAFNVLPNKERQEIIGEVTALYSDNEAQDALLEGALAITGLDTTEARVVMEGSYGDMFRETFLRNVASLAGKVHPSMIGYKAAEMTIASKSFTDRPLQAISNAGVEYDMGNNRPIPGLDDQWTKSIIDQGGRFIIKAGTYVELPFGGEMRYTADGRERPTYMYNDPATGKTAVNEATGEIITFTPDPDNYGPKLKRESEERARKTKNTLQKAQDSLAYLYEYIDPGLLQPDYYFDSRDLPFDESQLSQNPSRAKKIDASSEVPIRWFASYDSEQAEPVELTTKEESWIITQLTTGFERMRIEVEKTSGPMPEAKIWEHEQHLQRAISGALLNASYNWKNYPDLTSEIYQAMYDRGSLGDFGNFNQNLTINASNLRLN
jgi:hypothetical protein